MALGERASPIAAAERVLRDTDWKADCRGDLWGDSRSVWPSPDRADVASRERNDSGLFAGVDSSRYLTPRESWLYPTRTLLAGVRG